MLVEDIVRYDPASNDSAETGRAGMNWTYPCMTSLILSLEERLRGGYEYELHCELVLIEFRVNQRGRDFKSVRKSMKGRTK